MKTWSRKYLWIGFVILIGIAGFYVISGIQPKYSSLNPEIKLVRQFTAVTNPTLAEILERSVVFIPAGNFIRGSDAGKYNEGPLQTVYLDAFEMDRFEVTNIQYSRFMMAADNKPPPNWVDGAYPYGQADYPVLERVKLILKRNTPCCYFAMTMVWESHLFVVVTLHLPGREFVPAQEFDLWSRNRRIEMDLCEVFAGNSPARNDGLIGGQNSEVKANIPHPATGKAQSCKRCGKKHIYKPHAQEFEPGKRQKRQ